MNNPIRENGVVNISGQPFVIKSLQVDLKDIVLRGKGGIERVMDFQQFYNELATGVIKIPGYATERQGKTWEPSEYAEAIFRRDIIKLVDSEEYRRAAQSEKMSSWLKLDLSTKKRCRVQNHQAVPEKYAKGAFEALIPNYRARGGKGWRVKAAAKELVRAAILETYAKDDKLNLAATARIVNDRLKGSEFLVQGNQSISVKLVSRVLQEMPRDIVLNGRIDARTYRLLSRQAVNEFYVEHALELVQIDAKTIDMYVVDEFGRRFSKITLYSMVCSRTGYPVGIYVTAGTPSEYSLLKLLSFSFPRKTRNSKSALN